MQLIKYETYDEFESIRECQHTKCLSQCFENIENVGNFLSMLDNLVDYIRPKRACLFGIPGPISDIHLF